MQNSILIVDDEDFVLEYLTFVLCERGYRCAAFRDGRSALDYLAAAADEVALIVSDIRMPGMSGIEFLGKVRSFAPVMPFILLSGLYDQPIAIDAWQTGATDYLLKPVTDKDLIGMVQKHFGSGVAWDETLVRKQVHHCLGVSPGSATDGPARVRLLFEALGNRRFETLQHSQRVAAFSRLIGMAYGVPGKDLRQLEVGALLHDIGKLAIPHNVLEKPGGLNAEEWRIMKLHPSIGASLLSEIPDYSAESEIVLCHHERFDGDGYPGRLPGAQIPIGARIFAVADALDAICSERPYRSLSSLAVARAEVYRASGTQFDPAIVESFRRVPDSAIETIQNHYAESELTGSLSCLAAATRRRSLETGVTVR